MSELSRVNTLCYYHLSLVNVGSPNAGFTEGNVQTTKKVLGYDGNWYAYISSQCQNRGRRELLAHMGWKLSEIVAGKVETTLCNPHDYIDDDLFGFLDASKNLKRVAPVRTSPMISLNPYKGDRDLLTREYRASEASSQGGSMVETEIYSAIMKGGVLIELDRVGVFEDEKPPLTGREKAERVKALIDTFYTPWFGGKMTRFLQDFSPRFAVFVFQGVKLPFLLNNFVLKKGSILPDPILEALDNHSQHTRTVIVGKTHFQPCEDLMKALENHDGVVVLPMKDAFDTAKHLVDEVYEVSKDEGAQG